MAHRIELPKEAALPLLAAVALLAIGAQFLRPAELRRDLALELQSRIGLEGRYEVAYADCTDARRDTVSTDAGGLLRGFAGRSAIPFAARDDADAVAFARAARPDCRVVLINRFRRFYWGPRNELNRRVAVRLSDYPRTPRLR